MHPEPENKNKSAEQPFSRLINQLFNHLTNAVFYLAILFFAIGFNFSDRMSGNWYQQFMPNINGASIRDITFTDSLNGFAVTSIGGSNSYILKTTNSGDNWAVKFTHNQPFVRVQFINANTGFTNAFQIIFKTTNAGENWTQINLPGIFGDDMFVLNDSTKWLAMSESLTGGVFRTTNGGASWQQQINLGSQNPSRIYMFNGRIGFFSSTAGLHKTTNSGVNWINVSNDFSFSDMFFIDSLTGWKASGFMKKTTNGGINWINQPLPTGNFLGNGANDFMNTNNDTIWAVGETVIIGGSPPTRGILYRTTDGGNNWLFQIPDTAIHINRYRYGQFVNNLKYGWGYSFSSGGIHTTNGGDTTFLVPFQQISTEVPKDFILYQNYPNPFNPVTKINYSVKSQTSNVKLVVYNIQGKIITELVNQTQSAGTYHVDWNASGYSSGVYFYSLIIDGITKDTKKMLMVK